MNLQLFKNIHIKKQLFVVISLFLLGTQSIIAQQEFSRGAFKVKIDQKNNLSVMLNGKPFITKDAMTYAKLANGKTTVTKVKGINVINTVDSENKVATFRREVALWDDRIEITISIRQKPNTWSEGIGVVMYSLFTPASFYKGSKYVAQSGRKGSLKTLKGNGGNTIPSMRFSEFSLANGKGITLDTNPAGVQAWVPTTRFGEPVGTWHMHRKGDDMELYCGYKARDGGYIMTGKIIIYSSKKDFYKLHAQSLWHYQGGKEVYKGFNFGGSFPMDSFIPAPAVSYNSAVKRGWTSKQGLKAISSENGDGVMNTAIAGSGTKTYRIDTIPGYYLFAIQLHNITKKATQGEVFINNKKVGSLNCKPNDYKKIIVGQYITKNVIDLKLTGTSWCINGISIAPLAYSNEDFAIKRKIWLVDNLYIPVNGKLRELLKKEQEGVQK